MLIVAGNYWGIDMRDYAVNTRGEAGRWEQIFNSDGQEFGGDGVGNFGHSPRWIAERSASPSRKTGSW